LFRKSNLKALEEHGLIYGPDIKEYEPNFLFENNNPEEEEIDYDSEEDDTIINGVNINTGEMIDNTVPNDI